jgi:O-antigen ligase
MLSILKNEEYKDLFKMIIFGPILYLFLSKNQYRNLILNSIIISYLLFGIYFLYRFFVLHEARDFDLRPSLKIRHGDANFLCTFFSILIPISLMQAKNYFHKKEYILLSLFLSIGIFLSICTLLTESRMGIIATAIGMIYIFTRPIIRFNKITSLFIIFVSSGIYIFYKGEHILLRYADIQDKSNTDRYLTWKNGWQVFTDNPVFGAGMHKAKDFFYKNTAYPAFQSEFHPLEIHNTFLKTAAELGISGLIFFSLLFLWPWKKSLKCRSDDRYFLICSMTILTLSILTIGLVYKDLFMLHLFIIAALATSPAPEFKN